MKVRAKLKCDSVNPVENGKQVFFSAVIEGSEENKTFSRYTPFANLNMIIGDNTAAADAFEAGKEYYLDFSPAEAENGVGNGQ